MNILNWLLSNLLTILLIIASPTCLVIGMKIGFRRGVEKCKSSMTPNRMTSFKQLIAYADVALRRSETISRSKNPEKNSGPERAPWLILDRVAKLVKVLDNFYNPKDPKNRKTLEEFMSADNAPLMHTLDDVSSMLEFFKELLRSQRNNKRSLDNDVAEVERLGGAHHGNQQGRKASHQQGRSAHYGSQQGHPHQVRPTHYGYQQQVSPPHYGYPQQTSPTHYDYPQGDHSQQVWPAQNGYQQQYYMPS